MVSDVNIDLPMSHYEYHRQILSQKLISQDARFDCKNCTKFNVRWGFAQTSLGSSQRSPDYLAGYEWHEEKKKGETEKEGAGKGKKMEGRERVIRYPTFGQSDANGLAPLTF